MSKPSFTPQSGQIDFTHACWAPVINCILQHEKKILVVQRSKKWHFYPGYWNGISGFLDDQKSLRQKVYEELREEAGIVREAITRMRMGEIFHQNEPTYKKHGSCIRFLSM